MRIACHYAQHESGRLSWPDFLRKAGHEADAHGGKWACEDFYHLLNAHQAAQGGKQVEGTQKEGVLFAFRGEIREAKRIYTTVTKALPWQ